MGKSYKGSYEKTLQCPSTWMAAIFVVCLVTAIPTSNGFLYQNISTSSSSVVSARNQEQTEMIHATDLAKAVFDAVSQVRYKQFVVKLTENGSRHSGSEENALARLWIGSKLSEVSQGAIEVEIFGQFDSVIGRLPGTLGSNGPVVMIGAHFDTVSESPGANDDASGVAAVLELARVLSGHSWPLDIFFCLWNEEETGLHGSNEFAVMFMEEKRDILVHINIEMLLLPIQVEPPSERIWALYRSGNDTIFQDAQYWAELVRVMGNNLGDNFVHPLPHSWVSYWRRSDHYSFERAGYKSLVVLTGSIDDPANHLENDTWDNPTYDYSSAARTVASMGASIAFVLSRSFGQPTTSRYSITVNPDNTKELFVEVSMLSDISVYASWSDAEVMRFTLEHDSGQMIGSNSSTLSSAANISVLCLETSQYGTHIVGISNHGSKSVGLEIIITHESDIEGNGIPDSQESWYNDFMVDSDSDGWSDGFEEGLGTDRFNSSNTDADGDGISDFSEVNIYGTNPSQVDTDEDFMPDLWEIQNGLNPLVDDASEDLDNDGLSNLLEYQTGTLVNDSDSDSDGIPDGWEVAYGYDPLNSIVPRDEILIYHLPGIIIAAIVLLSIVVSCIFRKRFSNLASEGTDDRSSRIDLCVPAGWR